MNYDKLFISFLLKLILVLFLFNINLTNAFVIDTTGENNCNRIDTVDLGNGYSLKHYTLSSTSIRNVGRTELYYNGELKEYQDNIFYSNGFVMRWYTGGSCIVHSLISSVEMVDNTVKISYDYFNPQSYSSTTRAYYNSKPIYFELGNKNI